MRLIDVARAFVEGRPRRGCGMRVLVSGGTTYLENWNGNCIASITNRKDDHYTLTVYGNGTSIYYANRVNAVLRAAGGIGRRYGAYVRYHVKIYDNLLRAEVSLNKDRAVTFDVVNGRLSLDYAALERSESGEEASLKQEEAVLKNSACNNSKQAIEQLLSAVADI